MRDILPSIREWVLESRPFALARVVSTWGSAPRAVGAAMAVRSDNQFVGSVSGGCVEGAVVEHAAAVLKDGKARLLTFGVDDERAWSLGLSCGGSIRVLVERFPLFSKNASEQHVGGVWLDAVENGEPVTVVTRFGEDDPRHGLVFADERVVGLSGDPSLEALALSTMRTGASAVTETEHGGVFIHVISGKETLIIIGATDIASHLVQFANRLGFECVVIDPRPVFADASRFDPAPERLVTGWPDEELDRLHLSPDTYAVLLSHKPNVDDPALHTLLRSEVRYIGALGGKKTQESRRSRLLEAGFSPVEVDRIRGPVGLDIGASSPVEIALSIMAEIVATRNGL